MSFPRHQKYKDSGVEWLGNVPAHWDLLPLYGSVTERSESNKGMIEDNLLSLSYGRIVSKDISSNDGLLPESFETYQIVRPGDIVFRLTDLQNDKRSLRSAIVEETGIITSAYLAVASRGANTKFLNYLFRAYDVTKVFYSMGGGLRQSMKFSDLKRMPVLLPPSSEQAEITSFLDQETVKIDELVAEQQRLMELLKEKRQAVISHAVTKGLNPNAPMKPSGIEWLGDVPKHWEVKKIKQLCYVNDGNHGEEYPSESDYSTESEGVPFIRGGNLSGLSVSSENLLYITHSKNDSMRKGNIKTNDVLFVNRGDIGKAAIVPPDFDGANLNSQIAYLRACDELHCRFLLYFVISKPLNNFLESMKAGSVLTQFPIRDINNIRVPLPLIDEQQEIVLFLDREIHKFDTLTSEAQRAIDLLQERRTALISAAVTGQIDVRPLLKKEAA